VGGGLHPIARALGVKVILLPFFGKGGLESPAEMDYVGDVLREVAPLAEKAGVTLGWKTRSRPRQRPHHGTDQVTGGADLLRRRQLDQGRLQRGGEIRWLGADRICEVHLKDNPHYLGEGAIDFPAVVDALADIGFSRWAQLETSSPSGSIEQTWPRTWPTSGGSSPAGSRLVRRSKLESATVVA
jgi:sugar phosphate isomerase/epimerase